MPISENISGREYNKFIQSPTRADGSAVEVIGSFTSSPGPFAPPSNTQVYTYSFGTDGIYYTEVFAFYSGGTPASPTGLLKTVTIYYSDAGRTIEVGGVWS
jgi:hypothetical protein